MNSRALRLNKGKEKKSPDTRGTRTLQLQVGSTSLNHETTFSLMKITDRTSMCGCRHVIAMQSFTLLIPCYPPLSMYGETSIENKHSVEPKSIST